MSLTLRPTERQANLLVRLAAAFLILHLLAHCGGGR